jgi:hypothetical protein
MTRTSYSELTGKTEVTKIQVINLDHFLLIQT